MCQQALVWLFLDLICCTIKIDFHETPREALDNLPRECYNGLKGGSAMKRIAAFAFAVLMGLVFASCGQKPVDSPTTAETSAITTIEEITTTETTTELNTTTATQTATIPAVTTAKAITTKAPSTMSKADIAKVKAAFAQGDVTDEKLELLFTVCRPLLEEIKGLLWEYEYLSLDWREGRVRAYDDNKFIGVDPQLETLAKEYFSIVGDDYGPWIGRRDIFLEGYPVVEFAFRWSINPVVDITIWIWYSPEYGGNYLHLDGDWYIGSWSHAAPFNPSGGLSEEEYSRYLEQ